MSNGMNNDLSLRDLVKYDVWVRCCSHATHGRIVRATADIRTQYQEVGEGPNAGLNTVCIRGEWVAM
jgi:hypothetical protein